MATRDLVIGTAGHIDHGKTALVRALTGVDTDRLPAEKQRGITIDLGFAALDLDGRHLALIDVPGHERFIRNMLAGATGLDLALLVVAADDSVMPQTREHLEVLRFLGLESGLIALTKCDLVDESWLDLVGEEVRALVAGTFLHGAPIVRTSATTGLGLDTLREALGQVCDRSRSRGETGLFRMAIDRAFTLAGHGAVVTGTVASGEVGVGDELRLMPEGRPVRVRGLHRHDRPADRIGRGARAAVNLAGVKHTELSRGQELSAPGYLEATHVLSVELKAGSEIPRPVRHRSRYRLHLGATEVAATVALTNGDELRAGETVLAQLHLAGPVVAVWGQPFVIREESPPATVAGGIVLRPTARRVRRRDRDALARIALLASADPAERLNAFLADLGLKGANDREICRETGIPIEDVTAFVDSLSQNGALVELPTGPNRTCRVAAEVVASLEDRLIKLLARLHDSRPRQTLIPRSYLAHLPGVPDEAIVPAILDRLRQSGRVVGDARSVALAGHEPKLSQAERKLKQALADAVRDGGFSPPELDELKTLAGARAATAVELLALLREEERLVAISPRLDLDAEVVSEMRRRVESRLADGSSLTMADLRDLLDTSRKYAVPIGEYLDRTGLTVRDGDNRRLGPSSTGVGRESVVS